MTKKNTFLLSFACALLLLVYFFFGRSEYCYNSVACHYFLGSFVVQSISVILAVFCLFILPVSLVLIFLGDEVFKIWWRFAKWFLMVVVFMALFFNVAGSGGSIGMGKDFAVFTFFVLYSVFVFISVIRIVRAYKDRR